ncbi:DUF4430 domain-containing protein [Paenisporosarcina sp. FSL H8-0542]|uniref:DUF4430 domain-containing protein n=1 Tax=unclassified Paenisporosarcina TaxID=2642018 RepID=UPI0003A455C1|nr:DUF4430 domain-containing protein [Paenisporosarcina sp. HGH0030]
MRNHVKFFGNLAAAFVLVLLLGACGSSLQKPTGLEKPQSSQETDASEELTEQEPVEENEGISEESITDSRKEEQEKAGETKVRVENEQEKTVASAKKEVQQPTHAKEQAKKQPGQAENHTSGPLGEDGKQPSNATAGNLPKTAAPVQVPSKPPAPPVESPAEKEKEPEEQASTIVFSIVISSSEVPLTPVKMEFKEGDTVLDALIQITKKHKIQMDYRGGKGASAYVEGIANVYEFDRGQGSGWMYRVNGVFPDRGAGTVPLMVDDHVEWLYTTSLGEDLKADLKPFRR